MPARRRHPGRVDEHRNRQRRAAGEQRDADAQRLHQRTGGDAGERGHDLADDGVHADDAAVRVHGGADPHLVTPTTKRCIEVDVPRSL